MESLAERGAGRDAGWSLARSIVIAVATSLSLAFAIRLAGEQAFGAFSVVIAIFSLVAIAEPAVVLAVSRVVAHDRDEHQLATSVGAARVGVLAFSGVIGAATAVVTVVLPWFLNIGPSAVTPTRWAVALVGVAAIVALDNALISGFAQGWRRFALVSVGSVAGEFARLGLIVVLASRWGIVGLGFAHMAGSLITRWTLLGALRRSNRLPRHHLDRAELRAFFSFVNPLVVLNLNVSLSQTADPLVLGSIVGSDAAGHFRTGSVVPQRVAELLRRAVSVTFPMFVELRESGAQSRLVRSLTRTTSFVGGAGLALVAVDADAIVRLFLGRFDGDVSMVIVLSCVALAIDIGVHPSVLHMVAAGSQKRLAKVAPFEFVLNWTLTILLVRSYGLRGAAWATLLTIVVNDLVMFPAVYRHVVGIRGAAQTVASMLSASAIGGVLVVLVTIPIRGDSLSHLVSTSLVAGVVTVTFGWAAMGKDGRTRARASMSKR